MNVKDLTTPCFLVDIDILEENIRGFQRIADKNNTQLWPMLKTHKSTEITKMQIEAGAEGVLTGTLDEAEAVVDKLKVKKVMLAYPVLGRANLERVRRLSKKTHLYIAIDSLEVAESISEVIGDDTIEYLLIYDSGLGRFGVSIDRSLKLIKEISSLSNLRFAGVCTHTGQVYGVSDRSGIALSVKSEIEVTREIVELLRENNLSPQIVATGTTPTYSEAVKSDLITALRPGNYVFFDAIQVALGVAVESQCSLTVMATIVSHPREDLFILNCGSKCLGLDKGAHGSSLTRGYGIVKDHSELEITGLSEEVAKVQIKGKTNLKIGDILEIIPNHSCSAANMTSYLVGHRKGTVERYISVDMRGNSLKPCVK